MVAYEPPETLYSPRYSRDCESRPPSGAPRKRHAHRARPTLPMVAHTPTPTPGGPSGPNGPVPGDHRYAPSSANGRRPSACRGTKDGSLAGRGVYLWSAKTARADCHEPPQAGCDGFANHRYSPAAYLHPCAKRAPQDARAWDGPCARTASSHEITGFNARPVQCRHPVPSRPCQLVDRSVRVALLVAAGWNQAPASPAHEWSMEADFERPCASQPSASTRWYVKAAGSAKMSGDGTRLGAPAPAGCPGCDPACGGAAELQCLLR